MTGTIITYCRCGQPIVDVVYKLNGESLCKVCFSNIKVKQHNGLLGFNTSKDKLWEYTDKINFEKPINITSHRQFDRECKKRGLVHILNTEVKRSILNPKQPEYKPTPHGEIVDAIMQEVKEKGLYDKLKLRRR